MTQLPYAALITLLVLLLIVGVTVNVGRARVRYGIKAPAVSGHEMFERAYRVQMNTLESTMIMLPALWLCAGFYHDGRAAVLGAVWVIARIWYAVAYLREPASRGGGFMLSFLSFVGMWLGAMRGVLGTFF